MSNPSPPYTAVPKKGNKTVRRNDKTQKWPTYLQGGRITADYKEFSDDVAVCYDLVKIGSHIVGRPLLLIMGNPSQGVTRAATDGTNIWVPKMHPNRRVATKHELSHIYFGATSPCGLPSLPAW